MNHNDGYLGETTLKLSAYMALVDSRNELLAACKEFVRKCECGEARSRRSYAQMKAAIAKAEAKE